MKSHLQLRIVILACVVCAGSYLQSQTKLPAMKKNTMKIQQMTHQPHVKKSLNSGLPANLNDRLKSYMAETLPSKTKAEKMPGSSISTASPLTSTAQTKSTLNFRGEGSTLDSTYRYQFYFHESHPTEKIFYSYDDQDRKVSEEHRFFFLPWEKDRRNIYHYDEDGKLTAEVIQQWANVWIDYQQLIYTYDENGRITETITQISYSFPTNWNNQFKVENIYNGDFEQPDTVKYYQMAIGWFLTDIDVFELNDLGQPLKKSKYYLEWNSGDFIGYEREIYIYNMVSQLSETITQGICYWIPGYWYDQSKTVSEYNPDGSLAKELNYFPSGNYVPSWNLVGQTVFSYDDNGNLTAEKIQSIEFGGTFTWQEGYRDHIEYNSNGDIARYLYETKDMNLNDWFLSGTIEYNYNDLQLLEEEIHFIKSCFDTLMEIYKYSKVYNGNQQLAEDYYHDWNFETNAWADPNWRTTFEYNDEGLVSVEYFQSKPINTPDWIIITRTSYSYNGEGLPSEVLQQYWNDFEQMWINSSRTIYEYNALGQLEIVRLQFWNFPQNQWEDTSKENYTYNEDGLLSERIEEYIQNGIWFNNSKSDFTYNDQGQEVGKLISLWDSAENNWMQSWKYSTVYDPQTNMVLYYLTEFYGGTETTWVDSETFLHFWNQESTGVEQPDIQSLDCLFTNPYKPGSLIFCEKMTNEKSGTLLLYDMLGRLRIQKQFSGSTLIDASLEPGSYVLFIESGNNEILRRTLIIQ
jgi:hypothetical protein